MTPPDSDLAYPERSTGVWLGGPMDLLDHAVTMSLTGASDGVLIPGLPEEKARQVGYSVVFPNLLISPHPDYVMTHRLVPLAADRTWVECAWYFPEEAFAKPDFSPAYATEFWDITNREDWAACESVQRNVTSAGYRPGRSRTGRSTCSARRRRSRARTWKGICRRPSTGSSTVSGGV